MPLLSSGWLLGANDEFGHKAVDKRIQMHQRLRYRHSGCDFQLTGVAGKVVADILA
jgi:hypothetical protein